MRVHELAKELGVGSKQLVAELQEHGVSVKSHMSSVDEVAIKFARDLHGGKPVEEKGPEEKEAQPDLEPQGDQPPEPPSVETQEGPVEAAVETAAPEAPAPAPQPEEPAAAQPAGEKVLKVRGGMVVRELAEMIGIRPNQLISELMQMNVFASINQRIELHLIRSIAEKHGFAFEHEKRAGEHKAPVAAVSEITEREPEDREEDMLPRAPVVTFLGHVDHGKTSLMDKIRNTSIVEGEHGGITQHIGAYTVDVNGRSITFLDTPGHAAFTAMRARGANLTDLAVIVIAADDGIMPQTREAIMHAKAAGVSMMIAINKTDLPAANVDRVKQQLQEDGMTPEDWGGELICCTVSAQTGNGIDHLLEMILLQAEIMELKANPKRRAAGFVVEGRLEQGMGPVANLLISRGTLKIGDPILCGRHYGRVKALINDHSVKLKSAGPATPVQCLGLSGVPEAGARFQACKSEKWARARAQDASQTEDRETLTVSRKASLDSLFAQMQDDDKVKLSVIVKADTQGSVEAIAHSLENIRSDKVTLNIILSGTGNVTTNDVMLASASNAIVLGFQIAKESGVDPAAKHEGVEVRLHHVIYELIDSVRDAMTGLLSPEIREDVIGHAEVRQVYSIGKIGKIAGCMVVDGTLRAKARVRVKRGAEILFEGAVASLKHFQDDVAEVREAQECGIKLQKFSDFAEGDILEFYELREVEQSL